MTTSRLQTAQAISAIFAAVAVPVVVAVVGWWIQSSISQDSVRKDYVQMAVGILSEPKRADGESIRQWAIAVLADQSPVPFNQAVRADLESGLTAIRPRLFSYVLDTPMMATRPEPWVSPPEDFTLEQLIENYEVNMRRAQDNYIGLKYLQEAVRAGAEAENGVLRPREAAAEGAVAQ